MTRELTKEEQEKATDFLVSKMGYSNAVNHSAGFDFVTDGDDVYIKGYENPKEGTDDYRYNWSWDEINGVE